MYEMQLGLMQMRIDTGNGCRREQFISACHKPINIKRLFACRQLYGTLSAGNKPRTNGYRQFVYYGTNELGFN